MTYRYASTSVLRVAQIFLLLAAVVRGVDYLLRPQNVTAALSFAESSFSLDFWGIVFIAFGVLGLLGEFWMSLGDPRNAAMPAWVRSDLRWMPSYLAHATLVGLYAFFGVSALIPALTAGWGYSPVIEWTGYALGHAIFVRRRKSA